MTRGRRPAPAEVRFASRVGELEPDGCRNWQGMLDRKGYGMFWLVTRGAERRMVFAHRYAWEQVNGPIPVGLYVLHRCDNRRCINVDHLFLGTTAENLADMRAKGRHIFGEKVWAAKLTDEKVLEIRRLQGTLSNRRTAVRFGVSEATVSQIRAGKRWKHLIPKD